MPKWLSSAVWAGLVLFAGAVQAGTPQVLAVVETLDPVRFACAGGTCRAELSTFCLQREQPAPLHGTPYRVASRGPIDLLVTTRDGTVRRLPVGNHVRLASVRGFTAVTATISRRSLGALGATSAALAVGTNVSLLPNSPNVDDDLEDEDDTKLATGPFREIGQRIVEGSGARIQSVRAINALINFVPNIDDHAPIASREDLWRAAVTERMGAPTALAPAHRVLDECAGRFRSLAGESLARCLGIAHDRMLEKLTHEYWAAVEAGS